MKEIPFERPTDYYDERLIKLDEQICSLIKERKDISNNNPGFPPVEEITKWAEKYELFEEQLWSIFGELVNDDHYRPQVEPIDFLTFIPVLRSVEKEQVMYSVPFIRQYVNSSVVNFTIDFEPENNSMMERFEEHGFWELSLGKKYDCRVTGASGTEGHMSYNFIVSPPLPNDPSELEFNFIEFQSPFKRKPTGLEVKINSKN